MSAIALTREEPRPSGVSKRHPEVRALARLEGCAGRERGRFVRGSPFRGRSRRPRDSSACSSAGLPVTCAIGVSQLKDSDRVILEAEVLASPPPRVSQSYRHRFVVLLHV